MTPLQIAALIVAYLLAFARLFDAFRWAWAWIPVKFQPLAPAFLAAVPAIVEAFRGVTDRTQLTIAIMGALGTLTTAMRGALPASTFAKLDEDSKDALRVARGGESKNGSKPPPSNPPSSPVGGLSTAALMLLGLSLVLAPALPACSSGQTPQAQAAQARTIARAGYASAAIALVTLSDVHYAWQTAQREPTQAVIDLDAKILFALDAAKDALDTAKPWLDRGVAGDPAKEKILEALDMAALAASVLAGTGTKVPPEVAEALAAARTLLGGAS